MTREDKLLKLYEDNRFEIENALRKSGGDPMIIMQTEGIREFLRTLAKNNIVVTATYSATEKKTMSVGIDGIV
jgi:hypothetical protein